MKYFIVSLFFLGFISCSGGNSNGEETSPFQVEELEFTQAQVEEEAVEVVVEDSLETEL